ncbi:MAG: hypothetical protein IAC07_06160 [Bacteroidetes bacterium]|uniref:Uncharacterized protein n=1 Tax=Candidatus Cryptobacteroides gallistercoris TaxID=2840765 RepID=A0A940DND5_9BACT|nr:hypothetical protein [Candidatus Cryptobacteroides gallistercoris]
MTLCNKNCDIGRGDLLDLAKRYNIKGADALIEKAIGVVSRYELPVPGICSHGCLSLCNSSISPIVYLSSSLWTSQNPFSCLP